MRSPSSSDSAEIASGPTRAAFSCSVGIVDVREHDLPRRLAMDADGLDAFEDGLATALEHA